VYKTGKIKKELTMENQGSESGASGGRKHGGHLGVFPIGEKDPVTKSRAVWTKGKGGKGWGIRGGEGKALRVRKGQRMGER